MLAQLSAKQSADSLDPYAFERPLDSARRHSRLSDSSYSIPASPDKRLSRLPSQLDGLDPFGFNLTSTSSPFDAANIAARSSTPSLPPSPSSRSTRSLYAANGVASTSALSLGSKNGSQSQLSPPPAWQPVKPRSQSFGDAAAIVGGGARPGSRASYLSTGRGQGGLGPPPANQNRSKLSGEINLDSDAPDSPSDAGSLPFSIKGPAGSAENYAHMTANSSFNKRVMKAQKALEKERAKAAAKLAKTSPASSQPRGGKSSAPAVLMSSGASIAPSVRSNRSAMSSRLSSLFGGSKSSEASFNTPPSPVPSNASFLGAAPQTPKSTTESRAASKSPQRKAQRDSQLEEVIDEAVLEQQSGPQEASAHPALTPRPSMPTLVATPASPVLGPSEPSSENLPEIKLPDTPPMTAKPALADLPVEKEAEAETVTKEDTVETAPEEPPLPPTEVTGPEPAQEEPQATEKSAEVEVLAEPVVTKFTEEPAEMEPVATEPVASSSSEQIAEPALVPLPNIPSTADSNTPASPLLAAPSPSLGLLPSALPLDPPSPSSPKQRFSTSSPRPSISESIGARSTRSNISLTPSAKAKKPPTINLAVITGQEPGALSTMSVPPPSEREPKLIRRKSSFGVFLNSLGAKKDEKEVPSPVLSASQSSAPTSRQNKLSKSTASSTHSSSSAFSNFFRSRKQSAPETTARRPSEPKISAIPLTSTSPPVSPNPNEGKTAPRAPQTADSTASSATAVDSSPVRTKTRIKTPTTPKGMSKSRSAGEKLFKAFGRARSKSSPATPMPVQTTKDLPPVPSLPRS